MMRQWALRPTRRRRKSSIRTKKNSLLFLSTHPTFVLFFSTFILKPVTRTERGVCNGPGRYPLFGPYYLI